MLPCTTKRRKTTNLKSINNQKCQKIKLHGAPTTKELKKQSARPTRRADRENPRGGGRPDGAGWGEVVDCAGGGGGAEGEAETQSRLGTTAGVAPVGDTPHLTPMLSALEPSR